MRETVDKRQNRVAVKQQSLTFAGMGHIGQLMGADVQLLGQNLPVTVGLIEHIHKVRIFKNVRYFGTCQKVLHILRNGCRQPAPFAEALPDFNGIGRRLSFFQQKVEFIDIVPRGFSRAAVCRHAAPHGILNDEHPQLFELLTELLDVKADYAVVDVHIRPMVEHIQRAFDVDFQCGSHMMGFFFILLQQGIVQVFQQRHIFRRRVSEILTVDEVYAAVDDCFFYRQQAFFATHHQLTQRKNKVRFQGKRIIFLAVIAVDVQRVDILGTCRTDADDLPMQTLHKGSLIYECGHALAKKGYLIKTMNTINFHKSMHYNPFAYIHEEKDILKLVTTLMANTKGEGTGGDPFWEKSEKLLYTALIAYLHYEAPAEEQNFATLLQLLNAMEVREDDEEYQNPVDLLFEELSKRKPNSFAVRQYRLFQLAAGKTMKSILISCGARLAPFDIQEIRDATMYDELELDKLGDRKTALFLIMSDTDSTFNFLISMIYTQLFNLLCDKADDQYGGKLPVHVRCLIDECANIGQIPQLEKLVATIRSREISACLVLQTRSQLKAIYKDNADTIVGNMDAQIFLGGSEPTTLKDLSEMLGKETIDAFNTSDTRGNSPSYGTTFQKMGHDVP